jgi:ABC-type polysaccharide/polyol phosphate export permease
MLDDLSFVEQNPILKVLFVLNPFATLFESYRRVIYGTPNGGLPIGPDLVALGLVLLGSVCFLALTAVLFKRLEPEFAKVL